MPPKKKLKVQCGVCGAEFDHYYRKTHNEIQHRHLLLQNKAIPYKTSGAAPNPFAAAASSSEKEIRLTSDASQIIASSAEASEQTFQLDSIKDTEESVTSPKIPEAAEGGQYGTHSICEESSTLKDNTKKRLSFPSLSFEDIGQDQPIATVIPESEELESQCTWVQCAGKLAAIIESVESKKSLIHMVSNVEVPNCRSFLQQTIYFCQSLNTSIKDLHKNCQLTLEKLSHEKVPLSENDLKEAITSTDPGNRPNIRTDLQRKFLLQIGPQQPSLPKFPLNESCPAGRQRRFCA